MQRSMTNVLEVEDTLNKQIHFVTGQTLLCAARLEILPVGSAFGAHLVGGNLQYFS